MKRVFSLLPAVVLILAGCAVLGVPQLQTFNQKAAGAYTTITSIRQSANLLLSAGVISSEDANNVQLQADNLRTGLEVARSYEKQFKGSGLTKLDSVVLGLQALQTYVRSKEAPE